MCSVRIFFGIVFALLLSCTSAFGKAKKSETVEISVDGLQRLTAVIANVKKHYYRPTSDTDLFTRAVSGMLTSLDPHSEYLDKEALKTVDVIASAKISGIGVEVVSDLGLVKVVAPIDDTPASRAGIKSGDYIVQIGSKLVRDMSLGDAANMLRGRRGSLITLTIVREGENKPLIFKLRREVIKIKTVKERMLAPGYGYVRVALFSEPTERELVNAVKRLQKTARGALRGLILDLRNNPGGIVDTAVQIADDFLDSRQLKNNDLIVYARGQSEEDQMIAKAAPGDLLSGIPMVVLINGGSASASEILAGALQDHKRAIVVGTRSFGKGSMQAVIPIDNESAIKLTTAIYYTPLGRSIQAKGIEPDINIESIQLSSNGEGKQELLRFDESSLVGHIKNGGDADSADVGKTVDKQQPQSKSEIGLAYKDYQLYESLQILRSQNITRS